MTKPSDVEGAMMTDEGGKHMDMLLPLTRHWYSRLWA